MLHRAARSRSGEFASAACARPRADPAASCGIRCSPAGRDRPVTARGRRMPRAPARRSRQPLRRRRPARKEVDVERLGPQFDGLPVCQQPGICRIVDQGPDFAEAPAQSPARIVRHVPEYLAQPLAPVLASGQREIGEQRPRLARRRQRHRSAVADHLQFAEDPELQHVRVPLPRPAGQRIVRSRLCGNHASTATFHAGSHAGANGRGGLSDR